MAEAVPDFIPQADGDHGAPEAKGARKRKKKLKASTEGKPGEGSGDRSAADQDEAQELPMEKTVLAPPAAIADGRMAEAMPDLIPQVDDDHGAPEAKGARKRKKKLKATTEGKPGEGSGDKSAADQDEVDDDHDAPEAKGARKRKKKLKVTTEGKAGEGSGDKSAADQDEAQELPPEQEGKKKRKKTSFAVQGSGDAAVSAKEGKTAAEGTDQQSASMETEEEAACRKVCAANLPSYMGKGMVWRYFEQCGEIEDVFVLKDWWTGASRGVAFVTFADAKSAHEALRNNGDDFNGQKIRVNLALDRHKGKGSGRGKGCGSSVGPDEGSGKATSRGDGFGKARGKGKSAAPPMFALGDKPAGCMGILARGLSYAVSEADLKDFFARCGDGPTRVRLLVDAAGQSKGKAFVDFANEAATDEAIKLGGTKLKGRKLCVEYLRQRDQ